MMVLGGLQQKLNFNSLVRKLDFSLFRANQQVGIQKRYNVSVNSVDVSLHPPRRCSN
jgi:hypothetical protein